MQDFAEASPPDARRAAEYPSYALFGSLLLATVLCLAQAASAAPVTPVPLDHAGALGAGATSLAAIIIVATLLAVQGLRQPEQETASITMPQLATPVLEDMPLACIAWDMAGRITYLNPAAERQLGQATSTVAGMAVWDVLAPETGR